jgi:hypothetical protein
MKVEILRTYDKFQTPGVLLIDGKEFCKTLELRWLQNARSKSCIPEGTYTVVKRKGFPKRPYDHFHVTDVPGRDWILIHTGNYSRQILGCILVGDKHVDLDVDGLIDVSNSGKTLAKLYDLMPDEFKLTIKAK